jgi:hypothetical protein
MSKKEQPVPTLSKEYRRGDCHRHHNFDYHPVTMHHSLPFHDYLLRTKYESLPRFKTRIGKFVSAAYKAMRDLGEYVIIHVSSDVSGAQYAVLHQAEESKQYEVRIGTDGLFRCTCPSFQEYHRLRLPCKHVVIVACAKGHDILF